jgi:hypothetical protein
VLHQASSCVWHVTLSVARLVTPLAVAEIVTEAARETRAVFTLNTGVFAPAGTTMLAGTVATLVLLLASRTVAPEVPGNVSVAVVLLVPTTELLVSAKDTGWAGCALAVRATGAEVLLAPRGSCTVSVALKLPAA